MIDAIFVSPELFGASECALLPDAEVLLLPGFPRNKVKLLFR